MIDVLLDHGISAASTLVAAFAGAWFAYRLTDRAHMHQRRDEQVGVGNETLFLLLRQYNVLKNIKDQVIEPVRNDPGRFINMRPLPPLQHAAASPNYERLNFLLESADPRLLVDLMVENERFHAALAAVNERSGIHIEVVQPRLEAVGVKEGKEYSLQAIEEALGARHATHLRRSTESAIEHVDLACASLVEFGQRFAKQMKLMFPQRRFIRFEEKSEPSVVPTVAERAVAADGHE